MIHDWTTAVQFDTITVVRFKDWPANWLTDLKPGTLLLFDGPIGTEGGLLRLTKEGAYLTITADQAFGGMMIPWNGRNSKIKGITIDGTNVTIEKST